MDKYTYVSPMNEPARTTPKEARLWSSMQEAEGTKQQERFKEAISRKIFKNGEGGHLAEDMSVEAQYELIKAINDGRVDFKDVGQSGGRPGYTYDSENVRDPTVGLAPSLAFALQEDWDAAACLNPTVRKRDPGAIAQNKSLQGGGGAGWAKGNSLGTGTIEDGYVVSRMATKTSDYQEVAFVPEADARFTSTRIEQIRGAHANSLQNRLIPISAPGSIFGSGGGHTMLTQVPRGQFDAVTIQAMMSQGMLGYEAMAASQGRTAASMATSATIGGSAVMGAASLYGSSGGSGPSSGSIQMNPEGLGDVAKDAAQTAAGYGVKKLLSNAGKVAQPMLRGR
jgi:hypothetical protein